VPVYVSNEDYSGKGGVSPEERKAYEKIYHEALREKRSAGSVCVYLVGPDGKGLASMIVSTAAQKGKLQPLLDDIVKKLGTKEGKPLVEPKPQSVPPKTEEGDTVLHLVSRSDHRGSWGEFPAENWIVLKPADVAKLLPTPEDVRAGVTFDPDNATAGKILTYFYPQTETCDFTNDAVTNGSYHHKLEEAVIHGKVLSAKDGIVRARLDGTVKIKHSFYPGRDDDRRVNARFVGYADYEAKTRKLRSFQIVTESATYSPHPFAVAVAMKPTKE
jgi:hypothetical protein